LDGVIAAPCLAAEEDWPSTAASALEALFSSVESVEVPGFKEDCFCCPAPPPPWTVAEGRVLAVSVAESLPQPETASSDPAASTSAANTLLMLAAMLMR
jgi:hypothetical protein